MSGNDAKDEHEMKFARVLPFRMGKLVNEAVDKGMTIIDWLHKLQGQLAHRAQVFFNSNEAIKNPKVIRLYNEKDQQFTTTSSDPVDYHVLMTKLKDDMLGKYILSVNGLVGCSSEVMGVKINANGKDLFSTPIIVQTPGPDSRVPFSISRLISIENIDVNIRVSLMCSKKTFGKSEATGYFCSIDLIKVD